MSPRASRWLAGIVAGLLLLVGGGTTALHFWIRGSVQGLEGSAPVAGLDSTVTVYVDGAAIPHLFASSEADLFRAQGWLHASERLWQLELFRRLAAGRLAEVFGERALPHDVLVRTLGLWGAAGRSLDAMPPDVRSLLEAYVEGVNERLRTWSGPWPPEFLLLGIEPEPWTLRHSVAIGKLMALDLSSWRDELVLYRARSVLSSEKVGLLELPYPEWGPTIVEAGASPPPEGETGDTLAGPPRPRPPAAAVPGGAPPTRPAHGVRGLAARTAGPAERNGSPGWGGPSAWGALGAGWGPSLAGSNSWAVAGVRSWTGQPLIANDMHLTLRAPSTWYLNALHADADDLHVGGLSIPGVPGVLVGYNREVAWAFTNGMVDDADFTLEEVSLDGRSYRTGGEWEPFSVRRETIRVADRAEPVELRVRSTVRGPLITDILPEIRAPMSVLWTGRLPTSELRGILAMNRARDPEAFDRAVQRFDSPQQNVIYATARGGLGYRLSGMVPLRRGWDGSRPVPWVIPGAGWDRFWPSDSLPATENPPGGYLATANNLQAPGLYGVIGTDYPPPFRARRIVDRLRSELTWTVDLMRGLQTDSRSLFADRVAHRAVAAADRIGQDSVGSLLGAWNHQAALDSREATLFYSWLYRLRNLLAADELAAFGAPSPFPDAALLRTLEEGSSPWADDVGTDTVETLEGLEERAMRDAIDAARGRAWGEVHAEVSRHPLGTNPWLDRIFGFDVGPHPAPGGPHTVRKADPSVWAALDSTAWVPPFRSVHGPSQRFVAEMRPGRSLGHFLLPTGQSGNPFSPHYRDMAPRWRANELLPVPLYREAAFDRAVRTLQLLSG